MKISPLAQGGTPGVDLANSSTTTPTDNQRLDVRRIKMRTNVSPDRTIEQALAATEEPEGAKTDASVQTQVVEDTKPLSPQVAALAKERRAIQRERMELEAKRKELEQTASKTGAEDLISKLKAQPLSVLQEYGVTYDQLTEAILANSDGINPEFQKLKEELKALKEGVDKNFSDRDSHAEQQVLTEMLSEAESLANEGDEFSLIKDEGDEAYSTVLRRIYSHYQKTGQVLEVASEMKKLEDELLEKGLKKAQHAKIQSKLTPPTQPVQPKQNFMRTLTNKDSSPVGLSLRERAILAARGQLTKG